MTNAAESFDDQNKLLDTVIEMKKMLYLHDPNDVVHPVHKTLQAAVEIIDKLTSERVSNGRTPEEEWVKSVISKYQDQNQSLFKLRILIAEKEEQLVDKRPI